jgi:hypothetical protein
MRTRDRLNKSFFGGSLWLATLAGVITQSWIVFVIALVIGLAINVLSREIRFS